MKQKRSKARVRKPREEWRIIDDACGYEVSNHGNVRSFWVGRYLSNKPRLKKLGDWGSGYLTVRLNKKTFYVHDLVCMAFIRRKSFGENVNHKNGIKSDNRLENLEILSRMANAVHAAKSGLLKRRLMPIEVEAIRVALKLGMTPNKIAKRFSCSRFAIRSIASGRTWAWL